MAHEELCDLNTSISYKSIEPDVSQLDMGLSQLTTDASIDIENIDVDGILQQISDFTETRKEEYKQQTPTLKLPTTVNPT